MIQITLHHSQYIYLLFDLLETVTLYLATFFKALVGMTFLQTINKLLVTAAQPITEK